MKCGRCGRSTVDTEVCVPCIRVFAADLAAMPALLDELTTTVTRQGRTNSPSQRRTVEDAVAVAAEQVIQAYLRSRHGRITLASHVIPVDLGAADIGRRVRAMLRFWALELGWWVDEDSASAMVAASIRKVHNPDWVVQLRQAVQDIERAIDSRSPDFYLGPCDDCAADMYARSGDTKAICRSCERVYDIAERRASLVTAVRDLWAKHSVIANALAGLDIDVTFAKLNNWIARDRACYDAGRAIMVGDVWRNPRTGLRLILQVAVDDDERALYRVGDVIDRLDEMRQLPNARQPDMLIRGR